MILKSLNSFYRTKEASNLGLENTSTEWKQRRQELENNK
jgi:hypothetical protein